jgi:hypothetical protein
MRSIMFAVLLAAGLFATMLALLALGRHKGARRAAEAEGGESQAGLGAVDGAVFGLLGLLVAFTFAAAEGRFTQRRQQIVEEANAIGTAYLRLDLLPDEARDRLREQFKRYLDLRIETYRNAANLEVAMAALARSNALQGEIWAQATASCQSAPVAAACHLLLPALNDMIDITTTRLFATRMHQSPLVFAMLTAVALVSALLAGYGMGGTRGRGVRLHMLAYAAVMAMTVYVILDLEFPRLGLIRIDTADQVMVELRQGMK